MSPALVPFRNTIRWPGPVSKPLLAASQAPFWQEKCQDDDDASEDHLQRSLCGRFRLWLPTADLLDQSSGKFYNEAPNE